MKNKTRFLYKYRLFDERHLRILTHNELYFPSPAKLNDPFDCKIPVRYDSGTKDEIVKHSIEVFKSLNPSWTQQQCTDEAELYYKEGRYKTKEGIEIAERHLANFANTQIGIYSLSINYRNLLLWSHYSDSHSGFIVGYHYERLVKFRQQLLKSSGEIIALQPVDYKRDYPVINAYKHNAFERLQMQFLTKSKDWVYETEYRMIWRHGANRSLYIDDNIIERVILGCNVSATVEQIIISILKNRNNKPYLFKAEKSKSGFYLLFHPVRY